MTRLSRAEVRDLLGADYDALDEWCAQHREIAAGITAGRRRIVLGVAVDPQQVAEDVLAVVRHPDRLAIVRRPYSTAALETLRARIATLVSRGGSPWAEVQGTSLDEERGVVVLMVELEASAAAVDEAATSAFGAGRVSVSVEGPQILCAQ
jgi:hypothetical protein